MLEDRTALTEDIATLTRKMRTVFDNIVRKQGLTLARARILQKLRASGAGASQRTLADELEIEGPTLVRLLDHLEDLGMIARLAVEGDRRAKQIVLTEEGREMADAVEEISSGFRSNLLRDIDPSEVESARQVVERMHRNLGRLE